jgi:ribosomal protein L14
MLLVRSSSFEKNPTNSRVKFTNNSGLTIKKKNDLKSKYINGPASRKLNRRKLLTLFSRVVY